MLFVLCILTRLEAERRAKEVGQAAGSHACSAHLTRHCTSLHAPLSVSRVHDCLCVCGQARTARARRLRRNDDDTEVHAPTLDAAHAYHLFLSHSWSSGQDQMRVVKQRLIEMMPDIVVFLDVDDLKVPPPATIPLACHSS